MLKVRTEIRPTASGELGLFASVAVAKGSVVWAENNRLDVRVRDGQLGPIEVEFLQKYGRSHNGFWSVCLDNARFIRRVGCPNLAMVGDATGVAARDIAAGDELIWE